MVISTTNARITPAHLDTVFAFSFFICFSRTGTRYASTVLTIGFNRYAIPHPYSTGFRIDSIFNTVSEIAVTRSIAK